MSDNTPMEFASIAVKNTSLGGITDINGTFKIVNIPFGNYEVIISTIGYESQIMNVTVNQNEPAGYIKANLIETVSSLDEIVISGTMKEVSRLQSPVPLEVYWVSFDQLNENMRLEPRPVLTFIHTDWCKFCAMKDQNTFKDEKVIQKLKKEFYCIRLDARYKESITFFNREYKYKAYRTHARRYELTEFLGKENGRLEFPTTVILSKFLQPVERTRDFVHKEHFTYD